MSFQAMTWACDQDLPTHQKMVLLMLANRTNHETGWCFPSHKNLAKDCGMSVAALKRNIKKLEEAGLVISKARSNGKVSLSNQYYLNIKGVGSDIPHPQAHSEPTPGSDIPQGVGSEVATNQEVNNQEVNPIVSREAKTKKRASQFPDDFEPNDTCRRKAYELGVDISMEVEKFKDHHIAKGSTFKDWQAALRTWLRNANKFSASKKQATVHRMSDYLPNAEEYCSRGPVRGRAIPSKCEQPDDNGILTLPDGTQCRIEDWDAGLIQWDGTRSIAGGKQ